MSKRAEKAAQKIFGPIDKAVVNLVTKQELIDYQNLRMALKKQYIAGYEQAEKDTIERAAAWLKDYVKYFELYDEKGVEEFKKAMEEE